MARTPMLHAIQRLLREHASARSAGLSVGTVRSVPSSVPGTGVSAASFCSNLSAGRR